MYTLKAHPSCHMKADWKGTKIGVQKGAYATSRQWLRLDGNSGDQESWGDPENILNVVLTVLLSGWVDYQWKRGVKEERFGVRAMGRMDFPFAAGEDSQRGRCEGTPWAHLRHQAELPSSHLDMYIWSSGEWLQCKRNLYSQTHFILVLTTKRGCFQMSLYLKDVTQLAESSTMVF